MSCRAIGVHDGHVHARILYNYGMLKFRIKEQQRPQNANFAGFTIYTNISLTCDIEIVYM